jgi:hypothetical protein
MKNMYDYEKGVCTSVYHYGIYYHPSRFAMYKLHLKSSYPIRIARISDEALLSYNEILEKLPEDTRKQIESYTSGDIRIEVSFVITNHLMSGADAIHDIATDGGRNPIIKN